MHNLIHFDFEKPTVNNFQIHWQKIAVEASPSKKVTKVRGHQGQNFG